MNKAFSSNFKFDIGTLLTHRSNPNIIWIVDSQIIEIQSPKIIEFIYSCESLSLNYEGSVEVSYKKFYEFELEEKFCNEDLIKLNQIDDEKDLVVSFIFNIGELVTHKTNEDHKFVICRQVIKRRDNEQIGLYYMCQNVSNPYDDLFYYQFSEKDIVAAS